MERKKLAFVPQWKGSVEGFAYNFIKRNIWRTESMHTVQDLMQDAYVLFLKCAENYPLVNSGSHFMALFQTCLFNHICRLSNKRTKNMVYIGQQTKYIAGGKKNRRKRASNQVVKSSNELRELIWQEDLEDAPYLVYKLVQAAQELKKAPTTKQRKGRRETTNALLCRIAGVNPSHDLRTLFENWLNGVPSI